MEFIHFIDSIDGDPESVQAEKALVAVIADLESKGVSQQSLAKALGRAFLGYTVRISNEPDNYRWCFATLCTVGKAMQRFAATVRRAWVKRFIARTGRLYVDALYHVYTGADQDTRTGRAREIKSSWNQPEGHA